MAIESGEVEVSVVRADPACAIEEWTRGLGIQDVVRLLILLWAGPAAAMFVASTALLRQQSALSAFQDSMIFSRALFATLGVFTLLIGAMWLIRSGVSLPSFRSLGEGRAGWRLHAASLGVSALAMPLTVVGGSTQAAAQLLAAVAALVAGCGLARWLLATPLVAAQPLSGFAFCMMMELTIGWLTWSPESSFGIGMLGITTLARSMVVISCVLASAYALSVGHWPPVVSPAAALSARIRRAE